MYLQSQQQIQPLKLSHILQINKSAREYAQNTTSDKNKVGNFVFGYQNSSNVEGGSVFRENNSTSLLTTILNSNDRQGKKTIK
jgi:hypothetical protein